MVPVESTVGPGKAFTGVLVDSIVYCADATVKSTCTDGLYGEVGTRQCEVSKVTGSL